MDLHTVGFCPQTVFHAGFPNCSKNPYSDIYNGEPNGPTRSKIKMYVILDLYLKNSIGTDITAQHVDYTSGNCGTDEILHN